MAHRWHHQNEEKYFLIYAGCDRYLYDQLPTCFRYSILPAPVRSCANPSGRLSPGDHKCVGIRACNLISCHYRLKRQETIGICFPIALFLLGKGRRSLINKWLQLMHFYLKTTLRKFSLVFSLLYFYRRLKAKIIVIIQ